MKKLIFATLMAVAATGAYAQSSAAYSNTAPSPNANVEQRAIEATDRLNSIVSLTQDQYNQVLQLNRHFFSQPAAGGSGRPAARVNAGREQQLKTILNGDQWQTYQNARQQGQVF